MPNPTDVARIAAELSPYRAQILTRTCEGVVVNGGRRRDPALTRATNFLGTIYMRDPTRSSPALI